MRFKTILGATLLLIAFALPAYATAGPASHPSGAPADSIATPAATVDSVQAATGEGGGWGFRAKLAHRVRVLRILVNVAFALVEHHIGGPEPSGWGG